MNEFDKNKDEQCLLDKIKTGDETAFKALFYRYNMKLCLWAFKITKNKEAAEDIVQDFFIQYWKKKESLNFSPSFASYSYRSVYNASLNYLRDNEKYAYGVTLMHIADENFDEREEEHELQIQLNNAINELPEKCRKIFIMVTLDKKRHSEVATYFGISINTVKVQVSKAYQILRSKVGACFSFFL